LAAMQNGAADYTLTFRRLAAAAVEPGADGAVRSLFSDPAAYDGWAVRWRARLRQERLDDKTRLASMQRVNPACIPRNYWVEKVLDAALREGDMEPFQALLGVLSHPWHEDADGSRYAAPPPLFQEKYQTFCGT
ncbi:MAG: YdiU family protein, partial [Magnetococcales bacterium]|nr:YdiU family protein [Magnetococcales bacterium]